MRRRRLTTREALAVCDRGVEADHPARLSAMHNYAYLLTDMEHLQEAETLHRELIALHETKFGPCHPNTSSALVNIARFYLKTGRPLQAADALDGSLNIVRRQLMINFQTLSEKEKAKWLMLHRKPLFKLIELSVEGNIADTDLPARCWDHCLFLKGVMLQFVRGMEQFAAENGDFEAKALKERLETLRQKYAELAFAEYESGGREGSSDGEPAAIAERIGELEEAVIRCLAAIRCTDEPVVHAGERVGGGVCRRTGCWWITINTWHRALVPGRSGDTWRSPWMLRAGLPPGTWGRRRRWKEVCNSC